MYKGTLMFGRKKGHVYKGPVQQRATAVQAKKLKAEQTAITKRRKAEQARIAKQQAAEARRLAIQQEKLRKAEMKKKQKEGDVSYELFNHSIRWS